MSDIDDIMEQAQIFASTYALAGTRFDDGTKMHQSNLEKLELQAMIESAIESNAIGLEICDAVLQWIVKRGLGLAGDEFTVGDVISTLDELIEESDRPGDAKSAEDILRSLSGRAS